MSTTIDIYPTSTYQPTIREIRDRTTELYNEILSPHEVPYEINIEAYLSKDVMLGPDDHTLWLPGVEVTFAYCVAGKPAAWSWPGCRIDEYRSEDFAPDEWADWIDPEVLERARAIPYYWGEYRNMGGLTVSSIGYGLVAVAIAERVNGLIASWDSAFEDGMNGSAAAPFLSFWAERQLGFYGIEDFLTGRAFRLALEGPPTGT